jgi:hypothetical protein
VPWRFPDAGHLNARSVCHCRRLKTLYGALIVKRRFSFLPHLFLLQFYCSAPRRSHSPVPAARSERRRAQRRSKDGPSSGYREAARSVLDGGEHDGKMRWLGATHFTSLARTNPRRARHWVGADRASRPCIRSILWGSHHDAVIRIGGELRGGGSTLHSGSRAMVSHRITATSDVIGRPYTGPRQTVVLLSDPFPFAVVGYDAGRRTMPSDSWPVVTRRQSAMSSLRANATIIVLRVLLRPSAVRV